MGRDIKIDDAFWKENFLKLSKKHKKIQTKLLCLHHIQKRKGCGIIKEYLKKNVNLIVHYLPAYSPIFKFNRKSLEVLCIKK
jgi:hypothetical protein